MVGSHRNIVEKKIGTKEYLMHDSICMKFQLYSDNTNHVVNSQDGVFLWRVMTGREPEEAFRFL